MSSHPLTPLVPGLIWRRAHAMRGLGIDFLTHMTVVKLRSGGLWIHSPVRFDEALKAEIDQLGPVRCIVAPNKGHHCYAGPWLTAYPEAVGVGAPDLAKKRPDLRLSRVLSSTPEPEWAEDFEQVLVRGVPQINETVFFHRSSRSLIITDLMSNFRPGGNWLRRMAMRTLWSSDKLSVPLVVRLMLRDRAGFREDVARISAWPFERILLTHEMTIEQNAAAQWRQALAFLDK
ncbi:DUF4336 domain-containing protein [Chitinimonas lacunae]|uniref:DUF4336 domain-containing protein n=1 Tax=Chitinimonas lacunae TaxID=1963018 RepID=A0ABV8MKS4_9NEIS